MSRGREYDEAITIFSPEGRIYQVEYALELVKRGAPVAGAYTKDGVVLTAVEVLSSSLEDSRFSKKLFELDTHVATVIAGFSPDARVLVREARLACQGHTMTYDEPIGIEGLVINVGDLLQQYTQNAGIRPFGVSMIIAGVDSTGPHLLSIDPSGSYRGYKATALGMNSEKGKEILEKQYNSNMSLDDITKLCIEAVKTAYGSSLKPENINVAIIPSSKKTFKKLTEEEVQKYF
ncbi:archaeal proteasome endopeptidase complex subunit alpha [Candidatus Bathyarchaeota archaeon]|nr:archaeal proteasome endopeptidase complex subunit alpha [Candidatus Bathyarchaeota archaeon]